MNYVKEIRTLRGWTQTEMAERLGISFRSVQDLESKGTTPKTTAAFERLVGLGRQLGIDVQQVRTADVALGADMPRATPLAPAKRPRDGGGKRRARRAGLVVSPEQVFRPLLTRVLHEYSENGRLSAQTLQEIATTLDRLS